MFIEDNETIDVAIHYKKIGKNYIAYSDSDFKEVEDKEKYKKLTVKMKVLTWGLFNELQDLSTVQDQSTGRNLFNFKKYKEEKLKRLIVSWDATTTKEDKQIPIPVNEKNILHLAPSIAETIIAAYDQLSVIDEVEEKK